MSEQVKHFPSFEIRTSIKLITRIQFKSKRKFAFFCFNVFLNVALAE